MKPNQSNQSTEKSPVKRRSLYLAIAAIIINTKLILIPIDIVLMLTTSLAYTFGVEVDLPPVSDIGPLVNDLRAYGNISLLIIFIIIFIRQSQERPTK